MYIVEIIEESLYVPLNKNILYCTLGWEHLSLVYWHYTLHLTRAGGIWRLIKKEKEKGRFVFCDLKRGAETSGRFSAGAVPGAEICSRPLRSTCHTRANTWRREVRNILDDVGKINVLKMSRLFFLFVCLAGAFKVLFKAGDLVRSATQRRRVSTGLSRLRESRAQTT